MIEWMQRHRRWLVVTIWISTISFIAAGMVGWGSYNFGFNTDLVAKVGRVEITQNQFQNLYDQLYSQYDTNGDLDRKKAEELGIESLALNRLIEQALLKNLALDLGIRVSNQEVIDEIMNLEYFQKDGSFDQNTYRNILSQNQIRPSDFEENVLSELLVKKVVNLLPYENVTDWESKAFAFPFLVEDEVQIKIIDLSKIKISPAQEEVRKFWEKNQSLFKNPEEYKIQYVLVKADLEKPSSSEIAEFYEKNKGKYLDANGNVLEWDQVKNQVIDDQKLMMAEDRALKEYVALKKAQDLYGEERVMLAGDKSLGIEVLESLEKGEVGEVFKPIRVNSGFLTFKILEKNPPTIQSFEEAKEEAKKQLARNLILQRQEEILRNDLKEGFKGKNIGFLKRNQDIKGFTSEESKLLSEKIFTSKDKRGYLKLDQKIIVFEILNQRIDETKSESMKQDVVGILELYKNQIVTKEFYQYLQKRYKILIFEK